MREVAACVRAGGTVVFPTDTVYGIGCDPDNEVAIDSIYEAKRRSAKKPLALHVAQQSAAQPFVADLTDCAQLAMQRLWPGPVAIVVRRRAERYARAACGLGTISLRCPNHDLCRALLRATGPLAATSANVSGSAAFTGDAEDHLRDLPDATLAVLAGPTPWRQESTILDCTGDTVAIIREGAMSAAAILEKLGTSPPRS
ncbi:MAG: L-threonylcarbamoyladenylate synthase [Candidatus Eremiobacteraeota bacterium]|nr:L-threonylcarbamoyladenylate synthase [Candidatus Eremiobacteraeota bacterium]